MWEETFLKSIKYFLENDVVADVVVEEYNIKFAKTIFL